MVKKNNNKTGTADKLIQCKDSLKGLLVKYVKNNDAVEKKGGIISTRFIFHYDMILVDIS